MDGQLQERNGRQYFKVTHPDTGQRVTARVEGKAPSKNIVIFSTRSLQGHRSRPGYARRMADVGLAGVAIAEIKPLKRNEFAQFQRDNGNAGILVVASLWPVPEPLQQHPMTWIKLQLGDNTEWITRSNFLGAHKEGQAFIKRHYTATGQDPPPEPLPVAQRRQLQAEGQQLRRNPPRAPRHERPQSPPARASRQNAPPETRAARDGGTNQEPSNTARRGNGSRQQPSSPRSPSPNPRRSTNQGREESRQQPNTRRRPGTRQQSGTFPEEVRA